MIDSNNCSFDDFKQNLNLKDHSDILLEHYNKDKLFQFEKYFQDMEKWLQDKNVKENNNVPLLITGPSGIGKSSLIARFIARHDKLSKDNHDYILYCSSQKDNKNVYQGIYNLINKLKEIIDVAQKVDVQEQKIKQYFLFWLQICNKKIQQQQPKQKIILLFDEIENFTDSQSGKKIPIKIWLPQTFPICFRVIISAQKFSKNLEYYYPENIHFKQIKILRSTTLIEELINNYYQEFTQNGITIDDSIKDQINDIITFGNQKMTTNPLFVNIMLNLIISKQSVQKAKIDQEFVQIVQKDLDIKMIKDFKSLKEIISYQLDFYCKNIFDPIKLVTLILCLYKCHLGLKTSEILKICDITNENWKLFKYFFHTYIIHYQEYWLINNQNLIDVIQEKYSSEIQQIQIHHKIAKHIQNHPSKIQFRNIVELIHHQNQSKNYNELKEVNICILIMQMNCFKNNFFNYFQQNNQTFTQMETFMLFFTQAYKYEYFKCWQDLIQQGFDPVHEFNKMVDQYFTIHILSQNQIFHIMIQICRFLREFSDYENNLTPAFRHPPIQGKDDLKEIDFFSELKLIDMYLSESKSYEILTDLEKLKINNDFNRQMVRNYYKEQVKGQSKKIKLKKPGLEDEDDYDDNLQSKDDQSKEIDVQKKYIEQLEKFQKVLNESDVEIIAYQSQPLELNSQNTSYYYYKRFIWSNFLWICNSQNKFSETMQKCYQSDINYMSVSTERKFRLSKLINSQKYLLEIFYLKISGNNLLLQYQISFQQQYILVGLQVLWDLREDKQKRMNQISSKQLQISNIQNDSLILDQDDEFIKTDISEFKYIKKAISRQIQAQKDGDSFISLNKLETQQLKQRKNKEFQQIEPLQTISKVNLYEDKIIQSKSRSPQRSPKNSVFDANKKSESNKFFVTDYFFKLPIIRSRSTDIVKPNQNDTSYLLEKSRNLKQKCMNFNPDDQEVKIKNKDGVAQINLTMLKKKIYKHSQQEMKIIQDQNRELIKNYNKLFHENVLLARKIKNHQISDRITCVKEENLEKQQIIKQIQELENQEEQMKEKYIQINQNKERFMKILKLCFNNLDQNKQWITQLNFLHNNFKKMILWEKQDLKKLKKDIKDMHKLSHDYINALIDQIQYSNINLNKIKQEIYQKQRFDEYFHNIDNKIEQSLYQLNESLPREAQGSINKTLEFKHMKTLKQSGISEEDIIELCKLLDIESLNDPEVLHKNEKFQKFLFQQMNNQDLRQDIMVQHRMKIDKFQEIKVLQDKISDCKHYYQEQQTRQKMSLQQSKIEIVMNDVTQFNKQQLEQKEIYLNHNFASLQIQNQKLIDSLMPSKVLLEKFIKLLDIDFHYNQLDKYNLMSVLPQLIQKVVYIQNQALNQNKFLQDESIENQLFINDQTQHNLPTLNQQEIQNNSFVKVNQTLDLEQTQIVELDNNLILNNEDLDTQQQQSQSQIN